MRSWPLFILVACVSTASVGEGKLIGGALGPDGADVPPGFQMTFEWSLTQEPPGDDAYIVLARSSPNVVAEGRYELALPESVSVDALNQIDESSFYLGVAWVVAYPYGYTIPTGRQSGFDGLSASAATNAIGRSETEYALIYRHGGDSEFPRADAPLAEGAWMLDFPEGFSCGRAVQGGASSDYFEPVACGAVPIRIGSIPFEVPDWR